VAVSAYRILRGGLIEEPLTTQQAAELFHRQSRCADAETVGTLETGFCFWTTTETDTGTPLKLVHCTVTPEEGQPAVDARAGPGTPERLGGSL
jgi:hypothetical protein